MLTLQSSYLNCAPSYSFRTGADLKAGNQLTASEMPYIAALLVRGYTVSSADYESNELSAFAVGARSGRHAELMCAGHLAGHAVLDGIRATLNFNQSRLDPSSTRIASIGYSGGAFATGWAASLQPTYAPDVKLIAAAFGGACVCADLAALIIAGRAICPRPSTTSTACVLVGQAR